MDIGILSCTFYYTILKTRFSLDNKPLVKSWAWIVQLSLSDSTLVATSLASLESASSYSIMLWLDYHLWVWVLLAFFYHFVEDGKRIPAALNPWFERENRWILLFLRSVPIVFKLLLAGWWVSISEAKGLNRNASCLYSCSCRTEKYRVFTLMCCKAVIIIAAVSNPTWTHIKCFVNIQYIIRIAGHFYYIIQLNSRSKENVITITYTRNGFYKFWIRTLQCYCRW